MTTTSILTLPRSIYIEPTSRCNELCQQCPRTLLSREDDRDLSFDNFRFIVDQFPVLERVVLHGLGEPLLNKDLPQMIRYLKARGTYVLFNSNGIALTAKRGQELIDAGLDEYRLSMDGATRQTYARVRGVDAFDKIWRNIRAFIAMQKEQNASKPAVSLWFTAMRENLHELADLIDLACAHGIREIHLQRLVYFEQGLADSKQALFRRSTREELELVRRCEQMCQERGITFTAPGAATPLESLVRDFGDRPWSGCRRPYTLTYITSSGMRKGLDPRRVVIYAWCPLPIVEFAIQGHLDAATITFTVLAVLSATSNRRGARALTGFLIGMAALTKIYPIFLLVAVARRREWTLKQPLLLLTCFATIIVGYLPFYVLGHGQVLGFFLTYAGENTTNSGVVPQVIYWLWKRFPLGLQLSTIVFLEQSVDLVVLGIVALVVLALRLRERISIEAAALALIGTTLAISPHIFPWYATALLPWVATLAGRLWIDKRPSGKGLATAMAWYFTCTVLVGYFQGNSRDWHIYYALVYDVVLLGLAVAIVAEVRRVKATSPNLQATTRDV